MFDKRLIENINNGRCFVLVGSGPSCEVGYPSWHKLAKQTYEELKNRGCVSDFKSYEKYLKEKKYPELFRQAERDLGSREALVNLLRPLLNPTEKKQGVLYGLISKWPFASYLTTNYDDEIKTYLDRSNEHFQVIRNCPEDFYSWRDGASHLIQKLHSDLDHPSEVILTSADYRRVYVDDAGQYFREELCNVFKTFDIFIIGHSLADPDIDYILQLAQQRRGPQHPIYMVVGVADENLSKADEQEFLEKYNIVLVKYSNPDGTHSELQRMLKTADRFIVPRQGFRGSSRIDSRPKEEIESAIAIFLYRRLQGIQATDYLSPLILSGLDSANAGGTMAKDILSLPVIQNLMMGESNGEAIDQTISDLIQQGLVSATNENIRITDDGRTKVQEYQAIRKTERNQAYGQFRLDLKNICGSLKDPQLCQCQRLAEEVIVASFANRGSTIANKIFSGQSARPEELSDVFGYISDRAVEIENKEIRAAFVEAMYQFLVEPNSPQRKYLASISQGYFLYHLLGLDPKFCEAQKDIFQKTLWFCDSSVILPLIAAGCHNHDYAVELFQALADENALLYTTPNLLEEAWKHFQWALDFMETNGNKSPELLRAALVKGNYKQNLFLDGYIRLSADGKVGTFNEYRELIFSNGKSDWASFTKTVLRDVEVLRVINISELDGFVQDDWGEIEHVKNKIQKEREDRGTYRSSLQVRSEAEVWTLLNNLKSGKYLVEDLENVERIYFVSQGRIIDLVFQPEDVVTWSPESLYRYLSALPGRQINPDLLQQCMLHEYYYAGISFIDKERYEHFFGPSIDAAKAFYEEERDSYIEELEDKSTKDIDAAFERTPDLEKPFFVAPMGWQLLEESKRKEELAIQRAREAEKKVKQLESERDKAWKTRESRRQEQEAATLRNLQDSKHVRKRQRQARKRARKKGKR